MIQESLSNMKIHKFIQLKIVTSNDLAAYKTVIWMAILKKSNLK